VADDLVAREDGGGSPSSEEGERFAQRRREVSRQAASSLRGVCKICGLEGVLGLSDFISQAVFPCVRLGLGPVPFFSRKKAGCYY
jgi:hypothetical protein